MDEQLQPQPLPEINGQIPAVALAHLKGTVPWMRFIAIVGIVACAILVLVGLAAMRMPMMGGFIFVLYIAIAVVLFFPQLYLLQYANSIRDYITSNDNTLIEKAFEKQKSYWTYMGILLIIYLALIVLFLLIFIIAGASLMSMFGHHNMYQQSY